MNKKLMKKVNTMELEIVDKKKNYELKLGDVVNVNGSLYLIVREARGYIAKGFDGDSGSTGHHETLDELYESFQKHIFEHYSKEEYRLELKHK